MRTKDQPEDELLVWRYHSFTIDTETNSLLQEEDFCETPLEFLANYRFCEKAESMVSAGYMSAIYVSRVCIYCKQALIIKTDHVYEEDGQLVICNFCGWGKLYGFQRLDTEITQCVTERVLKSFNIKSTELTFDELGKYISLNPDKVLRLTPRQFEQLVGNVYSNLGYKVLLTQQTKDQGKDLILLSNGDEEAIVEVKRYKNTIGVDTVRRLRGVQFTYGHPKAILVASGRFSREAVKEANMPNSKLLNYELDLVDLQSLLSMLSVYRNTETLSDNLNRRSRST